MVQFKNVQKEFKYIYEWGMNNELLWSHGNADIVENQRIGSGLSLFFLSEKRDTELK